MITLKRLEINGANYGILTLPNGEELETIELAWNDNRVGKSCIPTGIYTFSRDRFGKHQWWRIHDVEGRTAIEIHEGYKPSHSQGCILLSDESLLKMLEFFNGDEHYLIEIS